MFLRRFWKEHLIKDQAEHIHKQSLSSRKITIVSRRTITSELPTASTKNDDQLLSGKLQ